MQPGSFFSGSSEDWVCYRGGGGEVFFSRVYGFDIGEVDVGVVECDEVNRVQMVG